MYASLTPTSIRWRRPAHRVVIPPGCTVCPTTMRRAPTSRRIESSSAHAATSMPFVLLQSALQNRVHTGDSTSKTSSDPRAEGGAPPTSAPIFSSRSRSAIAAIASPANAFNASIESPCLARCALRTPACEKSVAHEPSPSTVRSGRLDRICAPRFASGENALRHAIRPAAQYARKPYPVPISCPPRFFDSSDAFPKRRSSSRATYR